MTSRKYQEYLYLFSKGTKKAPPVYRWGFLYFETGDGLTFADVSCLKAFRTIHNVESNRLTFSK